MNVSLRRTLEGDLDFVLGAEANADNRPFVMVWRPEQHLAALNSPDLSHLIIETMTEKNRVGYLILAGLADPNQNIEFRRVVVTEKGKGYGRAALRLVKQMVFEELKAHRLWLDVKEHNVRARKLYELEGFKAEGLIRECIKTDVGFESLIVMSMLSSEYSVRDRADHQKR